MPPTLGRDVRAQWGRSSAIVAAVLVFVASAALAAPPAFGGSAGVGAGAVGQASIPAYDATVRVGQDGSLHVAESVTYAFDGTGTSTVQRDIVTREEYDATNDRVYDLSAVTARSGSTDVSVDVSSSDTDATITTTFAEPQSGTVTVAYAYDVDGAVAQTADGLEVRWPVLQGFDLPVQSATVRWNAPDAIWLSCVAGARGSSRPCTTSSLVDVSAPTMTQRDLPPGGAMVGILGLGPGSGVEASTDLQARWSLTRAFTASGTQLAVALAVVLLGLLAAFLLWWTRGRDRGNPAAVTSEARPVLDRDGGPAVFAPPGGVRPGQMGTLVDERADVVDVAATLVDLAVRNYLFIEELPRPEFGRSDWLLRRRHPAGDELLRYEREVFEAVFADGDDVLVSELESRGRDRLAGVRGLLYDDVVGQGWFVERPDSVRSRWTTAGWVLVAAGVVLTGVLAAVSTFGLVGVAVVLAGVALAASGQLAPARTSRGSRLLGELRAFRAFLARAEVEQLPGAQRQELIARCYPYALVFGLGDRWASALAATDTDDSPDEPLSWYGAPANWHLSHVETSLHNLNVALSHALGSRRLLAHD